MRKHIPLALLLLVGLALIGCQNETKKAEKAAKAWSSEIESLVTAETAVVIRVDLASVDFDAAVKPIDEAAQKAGEENLSMSEDFGQAKQKIDDLKKAGAKTLYMLGSFDDGRPASMLTVWTLNKNADVAALAELLDTELVQPGKSTPPSDDDWMASFAYRYTTVAMEHKGLLLLASRAVLDRIAEIKPVARPELAKAMSAAGGAPVAVAIIPPKEQVRQALKDMPPTLPEELGGGKTDTIRQLEWIALGVNLPPAMSIAVTVKCESADAAKDIKALIDATIAAAEEQIQAAIRGSNDGALKIMSAAVGLKVFKDFNLQAKGDTITGGLNDKQITAAIDNMVPVLVEARAMAKTAGSAMNLSNMGKSTAIYLASHDEQYPPDIDALLKDGMSPLTLENPRQLGAKPDYLYIFPIHGQDKPNAIIAYENYVTWPKHGINYLRADFSVQICRDEAEFKKLLDATNLDDNN